MDSQKSNGSFLNFFLIHFFQIYVSGHLSYAKFIGVFKYIIAFFIRINILGAINVFVTLGIKKKKIMENVKIFLILSFPSSSLKTPNCCSFLGLEPYSVFNETHREKLCFT